MTNLLRWLKRSDWPALSLDEAIAMMSYQGTAYGLPGLNQTLGGKAEEIPANFAGYVEAAYKQNGVVFACMLARLLLFSEARFQFRRLSSGRPGELFGTAALEPLERPWANATTGDLLTRAIQDVDLAGNFYAVRRGPEIKRMRPDWVTIVLGSETDEAVEAGDLDADVLGYVYHPGGRASGRKPVPLLPEQVAHFAPIPDPAASYRGMSWLTPIVREVIADGAATTHKLKFFENGATPNLVVSLDKDIDPKTFQDWVELFEGDHDGVLNAYKTLYMGGGATAEVVGANMRQLDFKNTQGAGETRIAAAAGVPPVIVGLSEGLAAATYSNYGQARRRFADGTIRPLWRNFAGSMATIVDVPAGAELWYDDRDIPFLQEDVKDAAEVQSQEATTIKTLVEAGYEPDTVIAAVIAGDFKLLKHSGLYSIQLQPPDPEQASAGAPPAPVPANGGDPAKNGN